MWTTFGPAHAAPPYPTLTGVYVCAILIFVFEVVGLVPLVYLYLGIAGIMVSDS